jgi:hypothetical protein
VGLNQTLTAVVSPTSIDTIDFAWRSTICVALFLHLGNQCISRVCTIDERSLCESAQWIGVPFSLVKAAEPSKRVFANEGVGEIA